MRLYALLFALFVLRARAASIHDVAPEAEKKIPEVVPEKTENTSIEQELIDQVNTIKDTENKLRIKPSEDIPVAVILESPESALKTIEVEDDIVRPEPDLNNPGSPQRQLHETQNPEYHDPEKESGLSFRQNINDAQVILRQGFQGVSDGIQHIYESSDQLKIVQQTIRALRDDFTSQINKLNDTIKHFLNSENPNTEKSANEQSKADFQKIETGLSSLKSDFNRGVNTLADGVDVIASLKSNGENDDGAGDTSTETPSKPIYLVLEYLQFMNKVVTNGFNNLTQVMLSQTQGQGNKPAENVVNTIVQADTPASTEQPFNPFQTFQSSITNFQNQIAQFINPSGAGLPLGGLGSGQFGLNNNPIITGIINFFQQNRTEQPTPTTAATTTTNSKHEKAVSQVPTVAPAAIGQKNVETGKDSEKAEVEAVKEEIVSEIEGVTKGHHGSRGDNDSIGLENKDVVKEVVKEVLPEEPKNEDKEEKKAEQTENKTE